MTYAPARPTRPTSRTPVPQAARLEQCAHAEPLAEAAVLGCLLATTPTHTAQLLEVLEEEDFTVPAHRHVLTAIRHLAGRREPVDPVTVLGQLRRQGSDTASTASRSAAVLLITLRESAPAVGSASYYTRILCEHTYRRRIQQAAVRLLQAAEHADLGTLHTLTEHEHDAVTEQQQRCATR